MVNGSAVVAVACRLPDLDVDEWPHCHTHSLTQRHIEAGDQLEVICQRGRKRD